MIGLATDHRFVTLTGTGGIGKTRLAIEVARHLLPQFADGVWIVELAQLGSKRLMLVLDNCEHVIGAAAELVEALLHAIPLPM